MPSQEARLSAKADIPIKPGTDQQQLMIHHGVVQDGQSTLTGEIWCAPVLAYCDPGNSICGVETIKKFCKANGQNVSARQCGNCFRSSL